MKLNILILFISILFQSTLFAENIAPCNMMLEVNEVFKIDPMCYDGLDGSFEVEGEGGIEPYMFSVNGGLFTENTEFNGLAAGEYTVIIKDDIGTEAEVVITLDKPDPLVITLEGSEDNICNGAFGGSIEVSASGGTVIDGYTYEVNGGTIQENGVFSNLANGFYVVSVFDDNQCIEQISLEISSPDMIQLVVSDLTDVSCFDDEDGMATIIAGGGAGGFLYSIDGSDFSPEHIFVGLSSGLHSVEAMDINGCIESISFTIDAPMPVSFAAEVHDVVCMGDTTGMVTLSPSGGTPPYMLGFGGAALDTVFTFSDLMAGVYSVEVVDSLGCMYTDEIVIGEPNILMLIADTIVAASCLDDGFVTLDLLGAQGGVMYSIGGIDSSSATFQLPVGEYTAFAQDSVGCSASLSFEILDLSNVEVSITEQVNVSCFGGSNGSVSISSTGGLGNIMYSLDGEPSINEGDFDSLHAGNYIIIASDSIGCTGTTLVTITQPDELIAEVSKLTDVACYSDSNGSIEGMISGGLSPYELWSDQGELFVDSIDFSINDLMAGDVILTVYDSNGCHFIDTILISENLPIQLTIDSIAAVDCAEGIPGYLQISADGGASNYEYQIDSVIYQDGIFTSLESGLYVVEVIDSLGCLVSQEINIGINGGLIVEGTVVKDASCSGDADGLFDIYIPNHLGEIEWSINGVSNPDSSFFGLSAGLYSIFAIDEYECNVGIDVEINEPQNLILEVINFYGGNGTNGEITVLASGGTEPYMYSIDDKMTFQDSTIFTNLTEDNYYITVIDANGCEQVIDQLLVSSNYMETIDVRIHPNPVINHLRIESDFRKNNYVYEIIDFAGNKLIEGKVIASNAVQVDVSVLPKGIYLLMISNGSNYSVRKFVKE